MCRVHLMGRSTIVGLSYRRRATVNYCHGTVEHHRGTIAHHCGSIAHCRGYIAHCRWLVAHCHGLVVHCRGLVTHCCGLVTYCHGSIVHCRGSVAYLCLHCRVSSLSILTPSWKDRYIIVNRCCLCGNIMTPLLRGHFFALMQFNPTKSYPTSPDT